MGYAKRLSECQKWYTEARQNGACKHCGSTKYVRAAPHPSGDRGQPIKLVGARLEDLRKWVEEAGWVCPRCSVRGGAGCTPSTPKRLTTLELVEELKDIRVRKGTVDMDAKEWEATVEREKEIRKLLDNGPRT